MGRRYAAVLGLLAFAAVLVRGTLAGGALESTLGHAIFCLLVFTILGAIIGRVAQWIVEDAIRAQLTVELAERQELPGTRPAGRQ
jgi:outer membrane lipoprotein SlyB